MRKSGNLLLHNRKMELRGKIVVISGASRGIGAASALALAKEGAHVVLLARSQGELDAVVAKVGEAGGKATAFAVDLADLGALVAICAQVRQTVGEPDVLVNNAGVGRWLFTEETPHAEASTMFKLPFEAAFHLTREFLPGMLQRRSGHIVNVNSPASVLVWPGAAAYASARWGLRGFSEALKQDLQGTGVGVTHIVFGRVSSNYFEANPGALERLPGVDRWLPVITPEKCGKQIVRAVRTQKREITYPFMLGVFRVLHWLMPGMVKWVVRTTGHRRS